MVREPAHDRLRETRRRLLQRVDLQVEARRRGARTRCDAALAAEASAGIRPRHAPSGIRTADLGQSPVCREEVRLRNASSSMVYTLHRAMSLELAAVLVTSLLEMGGLVFLASPLYRTRGMEADDAALYLQGGRVEEILREMRAELAAR
jgi:hypothetical protein